MDTATRVLSVRELAEATEGAEEATEAAQEPSEAPEAASDADAAGEAGSADATDSGSVGEDSDTPDGPDDADPAAPADEDATGADPEGEDISDTPDGPDDAVTDVDEDTTDADSEASDASDAPDGDDEAAGTGDARLRDVVAAWVASADEEPAAAAKDTKDAKADEADEADGEGADDATDAADEDSADEASTTDTAQPEAETDQADQTDQADGTGADKGPEGAVEPTGDGPESGADTEAEPEAESDTEGESDTKAESDGEAEAADATDDTTDAADADADADADANPATDLAPEPDESPAAEKDTDGEGDSKADAETDTGTDTAKATDEADAADKAPASEKPPVDQPTAVFKAPRPSAPAVDQPTTMLKLGDAARAKDPKAPKDQAPEDRAPKGQDPDAKDSDAKDPQAKDPETDAERTSTFVALKPLDDPSARKPRAADATTALPRVTKPPADPTAPAPAPQLGPERTTQQPLPPKPPLDLLAELTNTPPPPDTPVRTALRRVKIWTPLALLLIVVLAVAQAVRPLPAPELQLTASDSYTFKGDKADMPWPTDGQAALDVQGIGSFGSSGEQKPVPIASVAKVMTAYVILRDHPLKSGADGPKIEIDQTAQDQSDAGQESTVDVTKGDSLSQREALESILIASANNIARLLARWDAGSEKSFVSKMNDAAKDLGMTNTTYTDPSGLNNTTVSTAVDQVKLAKKAMDEPAFREVATMMSYVDYKGTKHDNWNRLVGYNDVVGIKTGTTTSALGNLVFAAKKEVNGEIRRVVGAVVRQPAGGSDNTILAGALDAGDKLIRAAQGALDSATILKKGEVVGYVDDGLGGRTPVVTTKDVTAVGWAGLTVKLTFAADDLPHTAKAGTKVGTLTVGDGSGNAVKVPVALQKELMEPGFTDKLTRLG
ncbi:D-alanyl-D-alanine carboxypeptidase [Streptomyces sp. NBC_00076]|uniref:D-alanyl-D-alanine carboxypeptidase n=1 Tax=Streptomyces sp. NBC_00076 TaxID=2975642 RepID=UPI00386BB055